MVRKIFTFLLLLVYFGISSVSFAEEIVLEIISEASSPSIEVVPEPVGENIPEEIIPDTPPLEVIVPVSEPVVVDSVISDPVPEIIEPVRENPPVPQEIFPSQDTLPEIQEGTPAENTPEVSPMETLLDIFNTAPEEAINEVLTVEIPTTEPPQLVEVEENSIFTPPGPEPEPWQPPVVKDPTTDNIPIGNTETQSDPQFLAENSVFVRRIAEEVVVDPTAKHSCKVDVFRTDISAENVSNLSVKFYGTSTLAVYDAEIGSLPKGIDVRFEKNNDYIYDFRGKETVLALIVTKQDSSLSGDFTIPIIYTHKGKKESSVICQLNIINEKDEAISVPVIPVVETVEPIIDVEDFILEVVSQDVVKSVIQTPAQDMILPVHQNISDVIVSGEQNSSEEESSVEVPAVVLPKIEDEVPDTSENISPPEPVPDPHIPEMIQSETVELPVLEQNSESVLGDTDPEVVIPPVETPPVVDSAPISSSSDVSSI